ncbi:MAG: divergent polysaccharide deacetylase family protein, partial [Candidatus Krumholzibacteria bacterium]|nr:divergent polysaccharide deacetylase family protein [Candidatus Krumholzibacteria bacterium]
RVWEVPCPEATNLIDLNIAFTKAAARAGARVRRGEERDGGRTLLLHVGSHRYDTHRITLRRLSRVARVRPPSPEPGERALVAIVIDDFGYSTGDVAEAIIDMDLPLTISIIPTLPRSQWALDRARARGRCTILHLPMEADEPGGVDVPPVTVDMSNRDIARMVTRYVDSLPGVDGVNNHQGSGATADRRVMEAVLRELERRDLFFLDSLTSPRSVAYNTAREMGVPTARNSVFLDADTEDSEVVRARLEQLAATARKHGAAVGIAHPHRWTLEALREAGPLFVRAGVEPVYLSEIVE